MYIGAAIEMIPVATPDTSRNSTSTVALEASAEPSEPAANSAAARLRQLRAPKRSWIRAPPIVARRQPNINADTTQPNASGPN